MLDRLKKKLPLKEAAWPRYEACFRRIELPARTILLREGVVARRAYFIEEGCLRVWFNNNGRAPGSPTGQLKRQMAHCLTICPRAV